MTNPGNQPIFWWRPGAAAADAPKRDRWRLNPGNQPAFWWRAPAVARPTSGRFTGTAFPQAGFTGASLLSFTGAADPLALFRGLLSPGAFFTGTADPGVSFTGYSAFGFFTCTQYPVASIDGVIPVSFAGTASPLAAITPPVGQKESCIVGADRPTPVDAPNYVY